MKKIFALLMSLVFMMSFTACGNQASTTSKDAEATNDTIQTQNEIVTTPPTTAPTAVPTATAENKEWKQLLKDYEKWVDNYLKIVEKYKADPLDSSILSDYTNMMSQLTEWSTKTEEVKKELEKASSAELAEYSAELVRIAAKIAKVAY